MKKNAAKIKTALIGDCHYIQGCTHFAKQANLLNGRTIHKIRPRVWKKVEKKLFPFIAQETETKTLVDRRPTDFVQVK